MKAKHILDFRKKHIASFLWIFSSMLLFLGVFASWYFYPQWNLSGLPIPANSGEYGDMFGAINALFTGLAFAGLLVTILLQSQELRLQRGELKAQRHEFEKQNSNLSRQRFETSFFQIMTLRTKQLEALRYVSGGKAEYVGLVLIDLIVALLAKDYGTLKYKKDQPEVFKQFHDSHNSRYDGVAIHLNTYLEGFCSLLQFVDESELSKTDKEYFVSLIFSFTTGNERRFLGYHNALGRLDDQTGRVLKEYFSKYGIPAYNLGPTVFDESHLDLVAYPSQWYQERNFSQP
jgi:hypothetical protein